MYVQLSTVSMERKQWNPFHRKVSQSISILQAGWTMPCNNNVMRRASYPYKPSVKSDSWQPQTLPCAGIYASANTDSVVIHQVCSFGSIQQAMFGLHRLSCSGLSTQHHKPCMAECSLFRLVGFNSGGGISSRWPSPDDGQPQALINSTYLTGSKGNPPKGVVRKVKYAKFGTLSITWATIKAYVGRKIKWIYMVQ